MTSQIEKRALFLDRDGVLNSLVRTASGKMRPPWNQSELLVLPGAIAVLNDSALGDWTQIVVTNQPDIARGDLSHENLRRINESITQEFTSIDSLYVCQHDNNDNCLCRKPLPGLLILAAKELGVDLAGSFMVGDRWVDIAAGQSAGTRTILINSDHSWLPSSSGSPQKDLKADFTISSIQGLLPIIRQQS